MRGDLIRGLLSACHHQFSWPRRDECGETYQVCVHCGVKYSYDWTKMRRIAPLEESQGEPSAAHASIRKCGTRKAWTPRERRLRHQVPMLFRIAEGDEWAEATSENVSRSGLLFRTSSQLAVGANVELILEMPPELTGDAAARVVCEGAIVRVEPVPVTRKNREVSFLMACTITEYKFAPMKQQVEAAQEQRNAS
ncbi:MAG TPA: PilZ domain-containing protein [Candidatus Acidoferrales bacterium]|nr:PilZ domain-containing protein [Candidatus Acidoferrales bacterium]